MKVKVKVCYEVNLPNPYGSMANRRYLFMMAMSTATAAAAAAAATTTTTTTTTPTTTTPPPPTPTPMTTMVERGRYEKMTL